MSEPEQGSKSGTLVPPSPDAPPLDVVPSADRHDKPPCKPHQIGWQYLAPEARMRRWTETVEILDPRRSKRQITIDFSLPDHELDDPWFLPTAFLGKTPVAPDLEVRDADGGAVSVPTKRENMAITAEALDRLDDAGLVKLGTFPELRELCREVIFGEIFEARVARLLAEGRLPSSETLLCSLLRGLEDQFLLWVPVHGKPACDQQIQICRRQVLDRDQLIPHRRVDDERHVETALGTTRVFFEAATGPRRFEFSVAVARLLRALGLASYEYQHETTESRRFASFHIRVQAPDGLVARDLGVELPKPGTEWDEEPEMSEVPSRPGLTYRGRETDLAHFHFSRDKNPPTARALTTLGIREGLTSLWAGAVVFTALLLWAVHRLAPPDLFTSENGQLEATVAVLLVGPALASVWAIRADEGELLERTLSGTRTLLLVSAVLSALTALSLAGYRPFKWDNDLAIEVYASLSYAVATVVVIGWVVALGLTWFLYRSVLTSARRNYLVVAGVSVTAMALVAHPGFPNRPLGIYLLLGGLVFAAIAAHPGRATDDHSSGPVSAGVAAFGTLVAAGWFLGFYDNVFTRDALRIGLLGFEVAVLGFALTRAIRTH